MAEVKVFYDRDGKTLTVWFTERSREYVCEETGEEVVLMKDASGKVIGFEKTELLERETCRTLLAGTLGSFRGDRMSWHTKPGMTRGAR